ncbi:hypothetical protein ACFMQL_08490 [Nonomuraea fastidiosa]|jgi:hypothetical protein|uniref:hypothetical protein n=1 Tax=Nonomuraea TaxID=83681 RepID=UPI003250F8B0
MLTSRIAAPLAAAALSCGALCCGAFCCGTARPADAAAMAASEERVECLYRVVRVKTHLNIRVQPGGEVLDKIYPGDRTWGPCTKVGDWRQIKGTENKLTGYAYGHYLKKLGRR